MGKANLVSLMGDGEIYPLLDQDENIIGRLSRTGDKKNDVGVNDESKKVSRIQCKIKRNAEKYEITNLNTVRRTSVNKEPIYLGTPLKDGDEIGLGPYRVRFMIQD